MSSLAMSSGRHFRILLDCVPVGPGVAICIAPCAGFFTLSRSRPPQLFCKSFRPVFATMSYSVLERNRGATITDRV